MVFLFADKEGGDGVKTLDSGVYKVYTDCI